MPVRAAVALCTAVVLALLGRPAAVRACSSYPRCPFTTDVLPRDGATDVPTNVWIRVTTTGGDYFPPAAGIGPLVLRERDGASVDSEVQVTAIWPVSVRALRVSAPLRPETTYELVQQPGDACPFAPAFVLTTFTTGVGPDETPPGAPVIAPATCGRESCAESSCCGPYSGVAYGVARTSGIDDTTSAADMREQLLVGDEIALLSTTEQRLLSGVPPNARGGIPVPGGALTMRAVDLAGNVSDAVPLVLSCSPLPDAGVEPPSFDAGAAVGAEGASSADRSASCSIGADRSSASHHTLGAAMLLLLVAAAARMRRRRRPTLSAPARAPRWRESQ